MKKLLILFIILVILIAGTLFWWNRGLSAVNTSNKTTKIFVVSKGSNVREIANNLKQEGLISDPVVFFLLVKQLGLDQKIQAGDFRLSPSMTAEQIAKNLTVGILDIWVTIPEGKRATEIAEILQEKIPSYQDSWKPALEAQEGYLFPDTYLIPKGADITTIINLMQGTFEKKYETIQITNTSLSKEQLVIIASLIEREAKLAQDRPLIASVITNRLRLGMPIQIDATIQYALGYQPDQKTWWKKNLTFEDLKVNSPYNSYTQAGLPPTPIANPGLEVLQAAANPAATDYLFYISDSLGNNHYAKTLAEHNANIKKYGIEQ